MRILFLQFCSNISPTKFLTPLTRNPTQVRTYIHFSYLLYQFYTIHSFMLKCVNYPVGFVIGVFYDCFVMLDLHVLMV